jgi:hypothetical protein
MHSMLGSSTHARHPNRMRGKGTQQFVDRLVDRAMHAIHCGFPSDRLA